MAKTSNDTSKFFKAVNRSALAINQSAAGTGIAGLLGFGLLFVIAAVLFIAEMYFLSMVTISLALLVYVTGAELAKLMLSSITVFFSSKHLTRRAAELQETLVSLQRSLEIRWDLQGELRVGPVTSSSKITLPDNALSRDIKAIRDAGKDVDYTEYVAHSYYVECHELYDYSSAHLEFVSGAMPLFGLIGTILGLIAMFDSLGADVSVESLAPQLALALKTTLYGAVLSSVYRIIGSRFEQRVKSLDYDFETLVRALEVLTKNDAELEVQQ